MVNKVVVRPAGTSWMSVLGGWIATIGAAALVAPAIAAILSRTDVTSNDASSAVPVVIGIFFSYLIGGYVAGRMAGFRTSWHGMMTAFFSLFLLLLLALLSYAADRGVFAGFGVNTLADLIPGARDLNVDNFGSALTFGAVLGFLTAIFAGWLGGVLAPTQTPATQPWVAPTAGPVPGRTVGARPLDRMAKQEAPRPRRALVIPSFGRKGGDRMEEERRPEQRETEVDRS